MEMLLSLTSLTTQSRHSSVSSETEITPSLTLVRLGLAVTVFILSMSSSLFTLDLDTLSADAVSASTGVPGKTEECTDVSFQLTKNKSNAHPLLVVLVQLCIQINEQEKRWGPQLTYAPKV